MRPGTDARSIFTFADQALGATLERTLPAAECAASIGSAEWHTVPVSAPGQAVTSRYPDGLVRRSGRMDRRAVQRDAGVRPPVRLLRLMWLHTQRNDNIRKVTYV